MCPESKLHNKFLIDFDTQSIEVFAFSKVERFQTYLFCEQIRIRKIFLNTWNSP